MSPIKRQDIEFNLKHEVENWTLDFGSGVLVITRSLQEDDLRELSNTGVLDVPDEIVIHVKPGYAMILSKKPDSEVTVSSIFPSVDGDLALDIIVEIEEVKFMDLSDQE